jgi:hypothetical protein
MATVPEDEEEALVNGATLESGSDRDLEDFEELSDYGAGGGAPGLDLAGAWWGAERRVCR